MKVLVKVWTRSPFYADGFTEVFHELRLDAMLATTIASYLSHTAANCSTTHKAIITICCGSPEPTTLIGSARIVISPGFTVRKGKGAYRDYTPQVTAFINQIKNKLA